MRRLNERGAKDYQRDDDDDRCVVYRHMRRRLRKDSPFTTDVDQLEWVELPSGEWKVAAVFELTQRQQGAHGPLPPDSYFANVLQRYEEEGMQADAARFVANKLGCMAFIVVFNDDATLFWIYNLTTGGQHGWQFKNRTEFEVFLMKLKQRVLTREQGT